MQGELKNGNRLLSIKDATELGVRALTRSGGMAPGAARTVAEHLVDANLCGHEFSSLPRILAVVDALTRKGPPGPIRIVREDRCAAVIDGGDNVAYVVSLFSIDKAVEICRRQGVAVVTANNTWFSGRLAYYVERAARQGYVAMHTTSVTALVAPHGSIDRVMGTNPIALAFPTEDDPLIFDIGTSAITWGDVVLAQAKGEPLPEGVAVDSQGRPTIDPVAALQGAFLAWGGQRGSALSLAIQALGVLAGSPAVIDGTGNFGLFFLVVDPEILMPGGNSRARMSELRRAIAAGRPRDATAKVHVPGDGSLLRRKQALAADVVKVDERVYQKILALC